MGIALINSLDKANKGKLDYDFICQMIDPDLNEKTKLVTEEEIEEFIVLKIVRDVNMPRLSAPDQVIFETVCTDMFFGTPVPKAFVDVRLNDMFSSQNQKKVGIVKLDTEKTGGSQLSMLS
jgi:hypothetical protein